MTFNSSLLKQPCIHTSLCPGYRTGTSLMDCQVFRISQFTMTYDVKQFDKVWLGVHANPSAAYGIRIMQFPMNQSFVSALDASNHRTEIPNVSQQYGNGVAWHNPCAKRGHVMARLRMEPDWRPTPPLRLHHPFKSAPFEPNPYHPNR